MKEFLKKSMYLVILITGIAAAVAAIGLLGVNLTGMENKTTLYSGSLLRYNRWNVLREDGNWLPVRLPVYVRTKGREITIVNKLPEALESGTYIAFESADTYVTVCVDGREVYRSLDEQTQPAASMWNYVRMESDQANRIITITFTGRDAYHVGILPPVYLGPRAEILVLAGNEIQVNTQLSVIIAFFGVFVILCSVAMYSDMGVSGDFVLLGFFISLLGVAQWLQLVYPLGTYDSWLRNQRIGRILLSLLPPFYCFYRGGRAAPGGKRFLRIAFWGSIAFYLLVLIIHRIAPTAALPSMRVPTYAVFELIFALCLFSTIRLEREGTVRYKTLTGAGLVVLMLGAGLESFTHLGYTAMRNFRPLILGALGFSMLQTAAVLLNVFDRANQQIRDAQELSESRIRLMMNQMRPHFIRSALGAIGTIIRQDPDRAYSLLRDFTNYISFNIESMDSTELIPFREELKHIKAYANIEQERYRPRVRVEYDVGPEMFLLPPLTVQPYVENAIRHGVWAKKEGGTVCLRTEETENADVVTIIDDGVGFDVNDPPAAIRGHGLSMKNAAYRLKVQVGGTVTVESAPGVGTSVTITIPKWRKEEKK